MNWNHWGSTRLWKLQQRRNRSWLPGIFTPTKKTLQIRLKMKFSCPHFISSAQKGKQSFRFPTLCHYTLSIGWNTKSHILSLIKIMSPALGDPSNTQVGKEKRTELGIQISETWFYSVTNQWLTLGNLYPLGAYFVFCYMKIIYDLPFLSSYYNFLPSFHS
jgi:hypothetical protein